MWKFNFEITALKLAANICLAVRDRENTINNNSSVDELKNEMYGLNINSNKNFSKPKDVKKMALGDIVTVVINQNNVKGRSID